MASLVFSSTPSVVGPRPALSLPALPLVSPLFSTCPQAASSWSGRPRFPSLQLEKESTRRAALVSVRASSTSPSAVAANLSEVSILSVETDQPVKFKDLWDQEEGIAVVALLRHFGCFCCWELASVLRDSIPTFDSAGVKLIAVGVGTPHKARILAERLPFPLECLYADPDCKAYETLGLYHGLARTFLNPASRKILSRLDSVQRATKNYTMEATPKDLSGVLQQGGMFVFKGKELLYARKDEGTGDHAPLDEVLKYCRI